MQKVVILLMFVMVVFGDIMDRHSKMVGECLMMLEKNIADGTLSANLTGVSAMEELCDEFVSHIIAWSN